MKINFQNHSGAFWMKLDQRFSITIKYDVDTTNKTVTYADFRVRPYSLEETFTNILTLFDYKAVKQGEDVYKIKRFEYPRRTPADGKKALAYLNTLYSNTTEWDKRKECLRKEVRDLFKIDEVLFKRVKPEPVFSKFRKFDGYTVQNFYLETLPGLYVCGSVYSPKKKGKHPLILCPNGAIGVMDVTIQIYKYVLVPLARMGAIAVSYDLFGWGESELQVTGCGTSHI